MRVLGISGSLRRDLRQTVEVEESGVTPDAVADLRAAMREADAVLISTPEYNSSIPGALKNALDWASRPAGESALMGTPAAVIGASTGMFGAVWAQAETRKVLGALGGRVLEREYPFPRAQDAYEDGEIRRTPEQSETLEDLLRELIASAEEAEEARTQAAAA